MRYFGDSYDIVKQSLLRWLRRFGGWSVHPMFTEVVSPSETAAFEKFLGAKVASTDVLTNGTDRNAYFACGYSCGNLFLDPDTGLKLKDTRGVRAPQYLFARELNRITAERRGYLTVVFDQSIARGQEENHLEQKLRHLLGHGIYAFAYRSHACFVVAGRDRTLVEHARAHLIVESGLPEGRLLPVLGEA